MRSYYEGINYRPVGLRKIYKVLEKVIRKENKKPGDLCFIFTSDDLLLGLNKEFLNHDYYTDVIAFSYNEYNTVSGDIYISVDRVKENARDYKVSLNKEIARVMIHGVLHLCGYNDKTEAQKKKMRKMEDYWISELL